MKPYEWRDYEGYAHSEKPPVRTWNLKRPDGSPSYIWLEGEPDEAMHGLMFAIWRECNEMIGADGFSSDGTYPMCDEEKAFIADLVRRATAGEFSPTMCADILGLPRPPRQKTPEELAAIAKMRAAMTDAQREAFEAATAGRFRT